MQGDVITNLTNVTSQWLTSHRSLLAEDEDLYLAKKDPGIIITQYELDTAGSELGFFCVCMLGCVYFLLNQVDGHILRVGIFLMNREFNLLKSDGTVLFLNYMLGALSWLSLLMPLVTLAVWGSGMIIRAKDFGEMPIGGIGILLCGLAFYFFTFAFLKLKWNMYQFKILNGVAFGLAFALLTAY
jgi:hypothetical protein